MNRDFLTAQQQEYRRAFEALEVKISGIDELLLHATTNNEANAIRDLKKRRNRAEAQKRRVARKLDIEAGR